MSDTSLDPADWEEFRRTAHRALDAMIDDLARVADGPVWRPMPDGVRASFDAALPRQGRPLDALVADVAERVVPYVTGNRHPLFMGWVHGAGTPVGMVAEMIAAGLNANCGGRDHVGIEIERQVTRWVAEMLGFPRDASGLFVTGTSMANLLCVIVAKVAALGIETRSAGLAAAPEPLTAYTSDGAHACIIQAMEIAGLGAANLRLIETDAAGALRIDHLAAAIAADRADGKRPFLVIGTAGTVNTGAIDPLAGIAALARAEGLWFHIDGAFGALGMLSDELRPRLAGLEAAHSVAFDFHKWAHVPYDAGFLLVRDAAAHKRAFASPAAYLGRAPRGLAAGETWPNDLGPDLSRGFRALKAWMTLEALGTDRIGRAIDRCCAVARHLEARLRAEPLLEVVSGATLNIVCWRLRGEHYDALNAEIVMDLHESGLAAPSMTTLGGRPAIRAAIVNHRTTEAHIDRFCDELVRAARSRIDA